ncbi:MAG TPA: hypothetical protein VH397_19455 [Xanthobacteraceae bacterium]
MKRKIALYAAVFALAAADSGTALAQPVPPAYSGPIYPGEAMGVPPYEVAAIVSSAGFEPLGRPLRQGPVYTMRALDPSGEEVRVIVNAQMGRIVRIVPVTMPRYGVPVVRPPGRIVMAAPGGYAPNVRMPGGEGFGPGGPPNGAVATAPRDPAVPAAPPLPRPRPTIASSDAPVGAAQVPAAPQGGARAPATTGSTAAPAARPAPPPVEMHE